MRLASDDVPAMSPTPLDLDAPDGCVRVTSPRRRFLTSPLPRARLPRLVHANSRAVVTARPARVGASARRASVVVRAANVDSVTPATVAAKTVELANRATPVMRAAGVATLASLAVASPAHADTLDEFTGFLQAFWEFRTGDPASFFALTVLPIAGPYLIFKVLIGQKVEVRKQELAAGGWIEFMAARGLDADTLTLVQLNAFAAAAERDLLDDGMVREFVRQLEVDKNWEKSTISVEDPRMVQATQRARAEKIIAMKEARAAAEATNKVSN